MAEANQKTTAKAARYVTRERLTEDLEKARQMAHEEGQAEAAVSACVAMAKLHGLMIERTKVESSTSKDMTDGEFGERLRLREIDHVRTGGRDYLLSRIAESENLLAIYDAGEFEEWAAQGGSLARH